MENPGHREKRKRSETADLNALFKRASKQYDDGNLQSAFRLFLAAAKAGDSGAQLALGNFYSNGTGVRRNRARALYWYMRAYRQGYGPAASNIAVIFRDENNLERALAWFERAIDLNDADANLEIAKICLQRSDTKKATYYLKQASRAKTGKITEASREEAQHLLKTLGK